MSSYESFVQHMIICVAYNYSLNNGTGVLSVHRF